MKINSKSFPLRLDNIDTDQIIPAQFLKHIEKVGLGKYLFYNWRDKDKGKLEKEFSLDQEKRFGGQIIIAGNNFGCGSSREHAAWALADFGIKAVISVQFAEIFKSNAYYNGILPIELSEREVDILMDFSEQNPETTIFIDLKAQEISAGDIPFKTSFEIDSFKKDCLLKGLDETQYLINLRQEIEAYELSHKN